MLLMFSTTDSGFESMSRGAKKAKEPCETRMKLYPAISTTGGT